MSKFTIKGTFYRTYYFDVEEKVEADSEDEAIKKAAANLIDDESSEQESNWFPPIMVFHEKELENNNDQE